METEEAKEIYQMRKMVVEPVIGDIKENYGFMKFHLRGLEKVKIEVNLISIAHNLKKIWMLKGKINLDNKNIVFYLVINLDYLNCGTACLRLTFHEGGELLKPEACIAHNRTFISCNVA